LAPDDADKSEGVAGKIWNQDEEVTITYAKTIDNNAFENDIKEYSQQTHVSVDWIKRQLAAEKTLAASFRGIPVELKGQKLGVLILDSRDPQAAANAKLNLSQSAFILGKLLERT
jgi:hypothetical protein